jgi:hypothetical protein
VKVPIFVASLAYDSAVVPGWSTAMASDHEGKPLSLPFMQLNALGV